MVKYIQNYYKILDVEVDATKDEIKKAYKRAVLKYHPDVNNSKSAEKKFKLIHDAYVVLSDENKRENYDYLRYAAKNNNQLVKRNTDIVYSKKYNQSNSLDTISNGIKVARDLENEVGLFSNMINLLTGSNLSKFNNKNSHSRRTSSRHMKHRHRRGRF